MVNIVTYFCHLLDFEKAIDLFYHEKRKSHFRFSW